MEFPSFEAMKKDLQGSEDGAPATGPCTRVGVILSQKQTDGSVIRWRMNHQDYDAAKALRGRFTDPRFRLLEIICSKALSDDEKEEALKNFITVFPHHGPTLEALDADMERLFKITYIFYVMFFIHRSPALVRDHNSDQLELRNTSNRELVQSHFPKFLHRVQKEVYYNKLQPCRLRMTEEHIADFMLVQDPPQVLHLLNGLRTIDQTYTPEEYETLIHYLD